MIRFDRRAARFTLATGIATLAAVTGMSGSALAGTPTALPTGTILRAASADRIDNSYIVALKPGSTEAAHVDTAAAKLVKRYGGKVVKDYDAALHGFSANMTATQAARLAANPAVDFVEQDAKVSLSATQTQTGATWGLDRTDQRALPLNKTYVFRSAANVTAYVLDTGIRVTHSEFAGRARSGWDFIGNDANADDCNGHGTHVAGTVGGRTYGVAKDVKLVAVRVLDCNGSGSYSAIIAGIDWVTKNAAKPAVANMSLGGTNSASLNSAVNRSIQSGVTFAVAAGNDNRDACLQSPASTPDAITVGATDNTDTRAYFSNYGTCVDIFAPGVNITSASYKNDTGTASMNGTSMASPHVAGAAALVLAANPTYTPAQVRTYLVGAATPNLVKSPGNGSPNKLLYTGAIV